MSYGGQTIALGVAPTNFDISSPLKAAADLLQADASRRGTELANEGAGISNKYNTTALQMLNRQSASQDVDFRNQLIRDAAAHAQDADGWDRAMKDAVTRGAPEAQQYIGRYTPLLQQRLFESYGGAQPAAAAAPGGATSPLANIGGPADQMDRAFANVAPEQMAASLRNLDMVSDVLTKVHDPQSWDAAIAQLTQAGIPQAQQFAGAYSPLRVQQLYGALQPIRQYLQNRLATQSMGLPKPLIAPEVKDAGGGLYDVAPSPTGGVTELVPPSQRAQYAGVDAKGNPVALDTRTGRFSVSTDVGPIEAKPTVAAAGWQLRYKAALALHPDNPDLAMQIANGQKGMSPADMRRSAISLAQREMEALTLAGTPPQDPQTWMKQKTDDYFKQLTTPVAPPAPPHNGPVKPDAQGVYHPATQKDFDAIPSGKKFVNPADGRTLTKK